MSLTAVFWARSSAAWRRLVRSVSAWLRRALAMLGTELLGLGHDGDEAADLVDAGAAGHVVERFGAGQAHLGLHGRDAQLFGEFGVDGGHLVADALEGGIERETGLDRDDEQVERIGQAVADLGTALRSRPRAATGRAASAGAGAEARPGRAAW
jgi:hypothetical protein